MMQRRKTTRSGIAWLEILLAIAALALVFQLIPSLGNGAIQAIDVRSWSRSTWFIFNAAVILALLGIRFGPDLWTDIRKQQEQKAIKLAKSVKAQELKEQRETIERMQESRSRRKY